MIIKASSKEYKVSIWEDFEFMKAFEDDKYIQFIIDEQVYRLYQETIFQNISLEKIILITATEENKTIEKALEICEQMTKIPGKKNLHLISFGGGIVQDITGFVANILYRGIKWTFVPTTLLAACDSCIGGKTSLNYKEYKNLLGTFYPPDSLHICPRFFHTLTEKDFNSGLGVVVKFNLMYGMNGLDRIEHEISKLMIRDEQQLNICVDRSLTFKKDFIEEDEFDRGIRIHLNFAHTFGHAIESMTQYKIPHGTAVAMGMIVANRISLLRDWLEEEQVLRMEAVLLKIINVNPQDIDIKFEKIISAIRKDKKQIDDNLTGVLMYDDMKLKIVHDLKEHEIKEAFNKLINLL